MDPKAWQTITRGVSEIISEAELKAKLERGKPLNIKLGVDPTAPDIHLGFTVVMRKLRQFQDLGHRVILIVGDYTATVGDPSGRNKTRPILTHKEVLANSETYKKQFFKIVDPERTVVTYNGDWFSKMTFTEVTQLLSEITVAQMLEREDFQNRYRNGQPISLHEFLYPMMQAYDSVQIEADVELGGMDQKFNVLRGRELQRSMGKEPQIGMFLPILLGTDGREKMSKSLGNTIGIDEPPQVMYHKLYTLPDPLMESYFQLLTSLPMEDVKSRLADIGAGKTNPNALKDELARNIVAQYHGTEAAEEAAQKERRIHAGEALPETMPEISLPSGEHWVPELLFKAGISKSNGEGRRLIENGGVIWDGEKITDAKAKVTVSGEHLLRAGKRNFVKIRVENC